MARYTRKRSTARSSRSTQRSYSRPRRARATYGRKRSYSRSGSSGGSRTIRIVVEQVAPAAAVGPSLLGMKQAAAPKVAKF